MHKNLSHYSEGDFETLVQVISLYSEMVLVPHIMAEVSSLSRQIKNPARSVIQDKLGQLIESTIEYPITSSEGVRRPEFPSFGLTDAVLLQICALGLNVSLLTVDKELALQAEVLGYDVMNFNHIRD